MTQVTEPTINLSVLDINVWRERLKNAYIKYKEGKHGKLYKALASLEPYYNTADGITELKAALAGRGTIKTVGRATLALEKFLSLQQTEPQP